MTTSDDVHGYCERVTAGFVICLLDKVLLAWL